MKTIIKEELIILFCHIIFFLFTIFIEISLEIKIFILLLIIVTGIFNSRHLLVLPIDLIKGKAVETLTFVGVKGISDFEFSKERSYNLGFYNGKKTLILIYNISDSKESDNLNVLVNSSNAKIVIEYYRYSKILLGWKMKDPYKKATPLLIKPFISKQLMSNASKGNLWFMIVVGLVLGSIFVIESQNEGELRIVGIFCYFCSAYGFFALIK